MRRTSSSAWCITTAGGCSALVAYSAAALPARAPNTKHSGSEQALNRRRAVDIGVYAAHHVVHDRAHRNQLLNRIDALVLDTQFAHHRKLRLDQLFAEVPQIEIDDRAVRRLNGPALRHLVLERLR